MPVASANHGELNKELNKIDIIKCDEKADVIYNENHTLGKSKAENSENQVPNKIFCTKDLKKHVSILCK